MRRVRTARPAPQAPMQPWRARPRATLSAAPARRRPSRSRATRPAARAAPRARTTRPARRRGSPAARARQRSAGAPRRSCAAEGGVLIYVKWDMGEGGVQSSTVSGWRVEILARRVDPTGKLLAKSLELELDLEEKNVEVCCSSFPRRLSTSLYFFRVPEGRQVPRLHLRAGTATPH